VAVFVAFLLLLRNAAVLFRARVLQGRVVQLRGKAPKGLVRDFEDVFRLRPVAQATLRVVLRGGAPTLEIKGDVTPAETQRLRNILGAWPTAKIRAAPFRTYRRG
jgi:hypothetical protein